MSEPVKMEDMKRATTPESVTPEGSGSPRPTRSDSQIDKWYDNMPGFLSSPNIPKTPPSEQVDFSGSGPAEASEETTEEYIRRMAGVGQQQPRRINLSTWGLEEKAQIDHGVFDTMNDKDREDMAAHRKRGMELFGVTESEQEEIRRDVQRHHQLAPLPTISMADVKAMRAGKLRNPFGPPPPLEEHPAFRGAGNPNGEGSSQMPENVAQVPKPTISMADVKAMRAGKLQNPFGPPPPLEEHPAFRGAGNPNGEGYCEMPDNVAQVPQATQPLEEHPASRNTDWLSVQGPREIQNMSVSDLASGGQSFATSNTLVNSDEGDDPENAIESSASRRVQLAPAGNFRPGDDEMFFMDETLEQMGSAPQPKYSGHSSLESTPKKMSWCDDQKTPVTSNIVAHSKPMSPGPLGGAPVQRKDGPEPSLDQNKPVVRREDKPKPSADEMLEIAKAPAWRPTTSGNRMPMECCFKEGFICDVCKIINCKACGSMCRQPWCVAHDCMRCAVDGYKTCREHTAPDDKPNGCAFQ